MTETGTEPQLEHIDDDGDDDEAPVYLADGREADTGIVYELARAAAELGDDGQAADTLAAVHHYRDATRLPVDRIHNAMKVALRATLGRPRAARQPWAFYLAVVRRECNRRVRSAGGADAGLRELPEPEALEAIGVDERRRLLERTRQRTRDELARTRTDRERGVLVDVLETTERELRELVAAV